MGEQTIEREKSLEVNGTAPTTNEVIHKMQVIEMQVSTRYTNKKQQANSDPPLQVKNLKKSPDRVLIS